MTPTSLANVSKQLTTAIDANAFSSKNVIGHGLKGCAPTHSLGARPH